MPDWLFLLVVLVGGALLCFSIEFVVDRIQFRRERRLRPKRIRQATERAIDEAESEYQATSDSMWRLRQQSDARKFDRTLGGLTEWDRR